VSPLQQLPLPWWEPTALARALAERCGSEGLVLLEGDGSPLGRRAVLGVDPLETVCCRGRPGAPDAQDPFAALQAMRLQGGPWLGWLAYEAGAWVEPCVPWRDPEMATLWAVQHDPLIHFDLLAQRCWLEGRDRERLAALAARIAALPAATPGEAPPPVDASSHPTGGKGAAAGGPTAPQPRHGWAEAALGEGGPAAEPTGLQAANGAAAQRPLPPSVPPEPDDLPRLPGAAPPIALEAWHWHTDAHRYADQVRQVRQLIAAGDLFQANLTACCEVTLATAADPLALWQRLRQACPAPFAGVAIAAGEAVISASPERFLRLSPSGEVETRPIKGTRPRSDDPLTDAAAAADLVSDPKDRAENVMIVDLLRNDLGRVCLPGSITVPQLVGLESYSQVHHLTSVVSGRLRPDRDLVDLLRACWPGGSITGAPKLRACRRLQDLEPVPRGPYCGSLFHLQADGGFDSSILIRSVMQRGQRLRVHAGGGIVADSDPESEAEEMGWKILPLLQALA
jgi:anthranilate/para-aminobenzoate synthase component I